MAAVRHASEERAAGAGITSMRRKRSTPPTSPALRRVHQTRGSPSGGSPPGPLPRGAPDSDPVLPGPVLPGPDVIRTPSRNVPPTWRRPWPLHRSGRGALDAGDRPHARKGAWGQETSRGAPRRGPPAHAMGGARVAAINEPDRRARAASDADRVAGFAEGTGEGRKGRKPELSPREPVGWNPGARRSPRSIRCARRREARATGGPPVRWCTCTPTPGGPTFHGRRRVSDQRPGRSGSTGERVCRTLATATNPASAREQAHPPMWGRLMAP